MLYLLDANVLIDANRDYYPIDRVPEFWEWLDGLTAQGRIKIPREIYEEINEGKPDALIQWLRDHQVALLLQKDSNSVFIRRVIEEGYGLGCEDLNDEDLEKMGRDPFLIAYALADPVNRVVVSNEGSKPSQTKANRHVPDVCQTLNVRCIKTFALIRELDFRTR